MVISQASPAPPKQLLILIQTQPIARAAGWVCQERLLVIPIHLAKGL